MKKLLCATLFLVCFSIFSLVNSLSQDTAKRYITIKKKIDSTAAKLPKRHFKSEKEINMNWQKLRKGMSYDEVEKLLGSPMTTEHTVDFSMSFWKYKRGTITFNAVSKRVSVWDK